VREVARFALASVCGALSAIIVFLIFKPHLWLVFGCVIALAAIFPKMREVARYVLASTCGVWCAIFAVLSRNPLLWPIGGFVIALAAVLLSKKHPRRFAVTGGAAAFVLMLALMFEFQLRQPISKLLSNEEFWMQGFCAMVGYGLFAFALVPSVLIWCGKRLCKKLLSPKLENA